MKKDIKAILVLTLVAIICGALMYLVYSYYGGNIWKEYGIV